MTPQVAAMTLYLFRRGYSEVWPFSLFYSALTPRRAIAAQAGRP